MNTLTQAPSTAAPVLQIDVINSNPSDLSNFNGFDMADQNTLTNCGDMRKKQIKLEFGVAFDCQPGGCTYSCQNPLAVVNIDEVKCVKKNKKKMELRPKKSNNQMHTALNGNDSWLTILLKNELINIACEKR